MTSVLTSGGVELRKFCSNNEKVLNGIENIDAELSVVNLGENENTKTLGLFWSPKTNYFVYNIYNQAVNNYVLTKRNMLCIAQVFKPLC